MNLIKKKKLAAKVLKVGKNRVVFDQEKLAEIKEAITKQDIRDLHNSGVIKIKDKKGRRKKIKRKTRGEGKRKKKIRQRKREYVKITRKLRRYLFELKKQGKMNNGEYNKLRKRIKAREFRSKAQLKEQLGIK